MSDRFFIVSLIAGISLVLALAAGCGGGGDEMTLEAYLTELDAIFDDVDEQFAALEEGEEELSEDASVEEIKNSVLESVDATAGVIDDAAAKIEELEPPDQVKDEHEELVDGLEQFQSGFSDFRGKVEGAETEAELEEIFSEEDPPAIQEAGDRIDAVCLDLQALADDNSIDVDLECEEE